MCWLEGETNLEYYAQPNRTAATASVLAFLETSLGDKRVRSYTSTVALNWP